MSDLAVLDLNLATPDSQSRIHKNKTFVWSASQLSGSSFEATIGALADGFSGMNLLVSAPELRDYQIRDAQNVSFSRRRSLSGVLSEVDSVVILNPALSPNSRHLRQLGSIVGKLRLAGKPVALLGATAGSLNSLYARSLARFVVKRTDMMLLNDDESAHALMNAGVEAPFRMGADPAWAELDGVFAAYERADDLVFVVDELPQETLERSVRQISELLAPAIATGLRLLIQPWTKDLNRHGGAAFAERLASRFGGNAEVLAPPLSMSEARNTYARSRAVVAHSVHPLMASACAGSQTISLVRDHQVASISRMLGIPQISFDATSKHVHKLSNKQMSSQLLAGLDNAPVESAVVRRQIDRAKSSIELTRMFISRGAADPTPDIDLLPLYPNPWRS